MSAVRGNATISQRMRALQKRELQPDGSRAGTRRPAGNQMAQQLGIAAIYAEDGANTTASVVAILAALGIDSTDARRYALVRGMDGVRAAVERAFVRYAGEH